MDTREETVMTALTDQELRQALAPKPSDLGLKDKDHLVYRDFSAMPVDVWAWVKQQLESFELILLTERLTERDGKQFARGQVFVHPDGLPALLRAAQREAKSLYPDEGAENV